MGTGYAIPDFLIGEANCQSMNLVQVPSNEIPAIGLWKLGIA